MGVWTKGRISVTPLLIKTRASLSELLEATRHESYNLRKQEPGWGSANDDVFAIGEVGAVDITPGRAQIIAEDEFAPEHLYGRIYWRELDRQALKILNASPSARDVQVLRAADVIVSRGTEAGELHAFVGTRKTSELEQSVYPALRTLVTAADSGGSVRSSDSPLDLGGGEIFRWMLHRVDKQPDVSTDLTLLDMHSLTGLDSLRRGTSWKHGAQLDRPDLLASLAGLSNNYGPAGITIDDSQLKLRADFALYTDGAFSPTLRDSLYEDQRRKDASMGPRIVKDLAFKVIPELRSAFNADKTWPSKGRAGFQAQVQKDLAAFARQTAGPLVCPHCSNTIP